MTLLYAICVWFTWTPATDATHYDTYLDNIFYETVIEEVEICSDEIPLRTGYICDDFNRVGLGVDWLVKNPQFAVQSDQLTEVSELKYHNAQLLWSGTTNTTDQFGRLEITFHRDNSQGFIFRSTPTNGGVGPHYEVHVSGSQVRWEHVIDASYQNRPDTCTLSRPAQDGDWFGATITGTGNDTVVEVFVSAMELGPDPSAWPSPECTLTGDPSMPVDTGNRVGVRSYTGSGTRDSYMDNVCVGDSEDQLLPDPDTYYIEHTLYVVGLNDAEEEGPASDAREFMWVPDFDQDDDGIVGFADFGAFAKAFGSDHPSDLWADADGSGSVGYPDFGKFVQRFGKCNDGVSEVECG